MNFFRSALNFIVIVVIIVSGLLTNPCYSQVTKEASKKNIPAATHVAANMRSVVYLSWGYNQYHEPIKYATKPLLAGEIVRQAFLMAARDELGLLTRDAWLGAPMANVDTYRLEFDDYEKTSIKIFGESQQGGSKMIGNFGHKWPTLHGSYIFDYALHAEVMEKASRTSFVEILRGQGYVGKPLVWNDTTAVPKDVTEQLSQANYLDQFAAVQTLHALAAKEGESPEVVAALSRGYANLSSLTTFLWNPIHKVFRARALLYAQRLAAKVPDSAETYWNQAYVFTVAGLHSNALNSLAKAEKLAGPDHTTPAFANWLNHFLVFDLAALKAGALQKSAAPIELWFYFNALEQCGDTEIFINEGLFLAQKLPECSILSNRIVVYGGINAKRFASLNGLRELTTNSAGRIGKMPNLPMSVRIQLEESTGGTTNPLIVSDGKKIKLNYNSFLQYSKVIEALLATDISPKTDSRTEPSWSALSVLLSETYLAHILGHLDFLATQSKTESDKWVNMTMPIQEPHFCGCYVRLFYSDDSERYNAITECEENIVESSSLFAIQFLRLIKQRVSINESERLWYRMTRQLDFTADELVAFIANTPDTLQARQFAECLLRMSPHSIAARGALLSSDSYINRHKKFPLECGKLAKKNPALALALGLYYSKKPEQIDKAISFFKIAAKYGKFSAASALAKIYRDRGDEENYVATLKTQLKFPDGDATYFKINSALALHYLSLREWQKALPYADTAEKFKALNGLDLRASCYEGMQSWENANQLFHDCALNITELSLRDIKFSELHWYFFCKRTGQGSIKDARAFTLKKVASWEALPYGMRPVGDLAAYHWIENQPAEASVYLEVLVQSGATGAGTRLFLAGCYERLARTDDAIQTYKRLSELIDKQQIKLNNYPIFKKLADTFADDLHNGGKASFEIQPLLDECRTLPVETSCGDAMYYLGAYLIRHNQKEKGLEILQKCMLYTANMSNNSRSMAGALLIENGIGSESYAKDFQTPRQLQPVIETPTK